jgi:hypothetical protein
VAATQLDEALDELYAASPEEFVLVRSRLERELRAAGAADAAAEVRRRRRPNLAAWAVNRLARAQPDDVAALVAATRRLADAQQGVLRGDAADRLRLDARDRQALLGRLAGDAVAGLRGHAPKPDAYRDPILGTLDAAAADPDAAADLVAGRLTRPLAPPAGFGPAPDRDAPPIGAASGPDPAARRALTEARQALKASEAAAKSAASELTSAELRADAADAHLREVERALERAQASAEQAAEQRRVARDRSDAARAAVDAAAARLGEAERDAPRRGRR